MRFRKGTTDHDGDGRMGGSLKENTMARKPTKAQEARAELEAAKIDAATTMDPQTGQDVVHDEKPTKAALDSAKAAEETRFAEADRKGGPTTEDIEDATLSRSIRGY